jgi:hypothetical protein
MKKFFDEKINGETHNYFTLTGKYIHDDVVKCKLWEGVFVEIKDIMLLAGIE